MGKLRTSILALQKLLVENPARQEKVEEALEKERHNIFQVGSTADEGWNLLYMELVSKFQKEKTTVADNLNKTLKEVVDRSFVPTLTGINDMRKAIIKASEKYGAVYEEGLAQMKADLAKAETEAATLRAIAEKKKKKWLASAEYKAKIKGYLEVIDSVDEIIKSQKNSIAGISKFDAAWVAKNFPELKLTMTVKDVKERASIDTENKVKAFLSNLNGVNDQIRGLRGEYKGMAGQMASIKKMAEDADQLELVDDAPKIDASKAARLLGISAVDKLKAAMQAQADGNEKEALKLFAELAKEEKRKDKAADLLKALEKSGLL